jgi:multiple sugar transport system permease protein
VTLVSSRHITAFSRARRGIGLSRAAGYRGPSPRLAAPRRRRTFALMVLPSVVMVLIIYAYPLFFSGWLSVHNGTLLNSGSFVSFQNFRAVLSESAFWQAANFTLIFTVVGVFGSWAVGLALAILLRQKVRGKNMFKALLLLPWVVPVVVSATSWQWLVSNPSSPVPVIAQHLGLGALYFLTSPALAKTLVCLFKVWLSFPFMMLMMSAALSSVEIDIYEAASVDGAGPWQRFKDVTLPLIARPTYISWILMFIFCIGDFQSIYLLTGGGPVGASTTLVVLSYETVFGDFQTGQGTAIGLIVAVVSVIVASWLFRRIKRVRLYR